MDLCQSRGHFRYLLLRDNKNPFFDIYPTVSPRTDGALPGPLGYQLGQNFQLRVRASEDMESLSYYIMQDATSPCHWATSYQVDYVYFADSSLDKRDYKSEIRGSAGEYLCVGAVDRSRPAYPLRSYATKIIRLPTISLPVTVSLAQSFVPRAGQEDYILVMATANQDISKWHWTYASASDICSSMTTYNLSMTSDGTDQATQELPQSAARQNLWICVRAENAAGLQGFAKLRLIKQPGSVNPCNAANPPPDCTTTITPPPITTPPPIITPPVSIQTCSGTGLSSGNPVAGSSWGYPGPSSAFVPQGQFMVAIGTHNIHAYPDYPDYTTTATVTRIVTDTIPNPNHDPTDPNSEPTIDVQRTETKEKPIVVAKQRYFSTWVRFNSALVTPAQAGAQDTSSNLTSETTYMRPDAINPTVNFSNYSHWLQGASTKITVGSPSYSSSSSVGGFSGTRQSDGVNASSSPANHYSQGTIEAFNWGASWSATASASVSASFLNHIVIPDYTWNGGPGTVIPYTDSTTISGSNSITGGVSGCSRTLVVAPPNCKIGGKDWSTNGWVFHKTETFSSHGNNGRPTRVYDVGPNRRSGIMLANFHNPFSLRSGDPTFSYDNGLQGKSTNVASVMQSHMNGAVYPFYFTIANEGIGAAYSAVPQHSHPSTNAINTPGRYRVTWIPKWKTAANSLDGIWNGSELSSETCKYDGTPADPLEGAQSHPAQNALVTRLGLNIWVHAEPPTCSVDEFLFEVNDPPTSRITLFNPNRAPMDVGRSELTISRGGYSQTNSAGSHVIAAASMDGLGNVLAAGEEIIDAAGDAIDFSGQFTALWSLESNMGAETWTTLFTPRPPQNSWFQDPDERIVTGGGLECASSGNRIVYLPFIKVFYGGLAAGGRFGDKVSYDACGENFDHVVGEDSGLLVNNSFVAGHAEVTGGGDVRGSSVEYALQANNIIGGFYSASQRSSDPRPLKGLTLSNNDNLHAYGGSFGRQACIAHYWREVEKLTVEPLSQFLDLGWLQNNDRQLYEAAFSETLNIINTRHQRSLDLKATIYVDDDVYITDDIINNDAHTPKWYDPSQIGYLSIIARGDINIAPNVTQIDAVLVAYPKEDSAGNIEGGTIRTCYAGNINAGNHFQECGRQLVVNGALIAEKVLFGRVHASVKQEVIPVPPPPTIGSAELFNAADRTRLGQVAVNYYTDVFPTLGLRDEVGYLLERGILKADDDCSASSSGQQFCPGGSATVSRGRVAIWLARALNGGADPPAAGLNPFTDVDNSQAWWPHVVYLANHPNVGSEVLGYKGGLVYSSSPALFSPDANANRAWTAVLLAAAFEAPATAATFYTPLNNDPRSISSYEPEIQAAINAITAAKITNGWQNCVRAGATPCFYDPPGSRKTHIAALLARAFVWDERGQTFFPTNKARNTKASEVINLLPEYFIGIPELPLFPDQIYKTDSVSTQPVNF